MKGPTVAAQLDALRAAEAIGPAFTSKTLAARLGRSMSHTQAVLYSLSEGPAARLRRELVPGTGSYRYEVVG